MTDLKERLSTTKGKLYMIIWCVYWCITAYIFFSHTPQVLGEADGRPIWVWPLYFGTIAFLVFCIIYCFRSWLRGGHPRDDRGKEIKTNIRPKHFIGIVIIAIYCFLNMELVNNTERLGEMQFKYVVANIIGCIIMTLIFLAWFNSYRRATMAIVCFTITMSLIFYYVYLCRGEPFQLIDIFSFTTAMEVTGAYEFVYTRWVTIALTTALCFIGWNMHWKDSVVFKGFKKRVALRAGAAVFMAVGYFLFLYTSWNSALLGITTDLWDPKDTYEEVGTNVGFFCVAKFMKNDPPEGYSVSKTEEIAEESVKKYDEEYGDSTASETVTKPVNIICIMNEAWADYTVFDKFSTNEEYMPFYSSLSENTIKGHTLVCISGGGTAKTEYEFLTGNSVRQYPGMVPYVSYYTHSQYSLVSTLEAQGYESAAMHPNKGTNWNRVNAYKMLGFDNFYTIDDFDSNVEKFRGMISDRANYEKIIDVIESKDDPSQPFFMFNVTMQDHGGYKTDNYDTNIQVNGYDDDAWNRYLSLANESDKALQYLVEYFEDCDEPTMIVMFGDHFPSQDEGTEKYLSGDTRDNLDVEEMQKYYQTPFFIWTNYDMESQSDVITSTNFLGTLMMQQTGLEMTDYEKYQTLLMKDMKAYNHKGYVTSDGEYVLWADATEDMLKKRLDYEYLQYNNLVESSKRLDWFFTIQEE